MENKTRSLLKVIFSHLEKGDYKHFWECFSDDVMWIVEGTHPLAGKYKSLNEFRKSTFDRLHDVLATPIKYKVRDILANGSKGAVTLDGDSTTQDGAPFHSRYCWIVTLAPNDKINRVEEFLDTQAIADLFTVSKIISR